MTGTTDTERPALPYRFFDVRVARAERVGPNIVRVTLTGDDLHLFVSDGRDQRLKVFLPHPGQDAPLVPVEAGEDWFGQWMALPADERAVMRTYTVREARPDAFDVDFALHGDTGPASRWARTAAPGDRLVVIGPSAQDNGGADFQPPADTDAVLIAADETALPAVEGILAWLPEGLPTHVWLSVPDAGDKRALPTKADTTVRWFVREGADPLPDAVAAAELPAGERLYAWIAGESGMVRAVRRDLVGVRGLDRKAVTFTGYWRRGATDDDLLAETLAGGNPHNGEDD
ncbi:siderophore-interacting protein [Yinghuangia seranimata]|uniref:siderophore-interacting protein n=1 Tax=Yinghuangia seranimata TaxID=408067 RepID=UPI00248C8041|nr:siderophore-interacting protein [Yinghuangia seranimata]MDI2129657.1 siderophore-interacting protein [Yinghuangia seranimata]